MQIKHISSFKKGRQVFTLLHYVENDFYELAKINASIGMTIKLGSLEQIEQYAAENGYKKV